MKKIMILGANTLQLPLINAASELGYQTVVVSPVPTETGHAIADFSEFIDIKDEDEILLAAKRHNICGITTDQTDIAVRSVAYVAEKLGLPGIEYKTACLFTDKYLMREKCKELGIPTLNYKIVRTLADALSALEELGGKAILKPIDNQSSKGVFLIDSLQKLKEKFAETMSYSKQKAALVEQVAYGREFVAEGIAFNGIFENLTVGDTYYFDIPDVFSATKRIFPTCASVGLRKKIEDFNRKIIQGFGLQQGITHSEYVVDINENIFLIETAARGGGVYISSDLIPLCTGLETEKFLINIATGNQTCMPTFGKDLKTCCYLAFFLPVGTVASTMGIPEVTSLPFVHHNNLTNIHIGMQTHEPKDKTYRYFLTIEATDKQQLDTRIRQIKLLLDNIKVQCSDGNIQSPIWS